MPDFRIIAINCVDAEGKSTMYVEKFELTYTQHQPISGECEEIC
jgi:hypothetical protein